MPASSSGPEADEPSEGGFILVVVIGLLLVLAIVAQGYALSIRSHVRLSGAEIERSKALALAEAGVNLAIHHILEKRNARSPGRGDLIAVGGWECRLGSDRISIAISDEAGRIDLNTADGELIRLLLMGLGLEKERSLQLAAAVLDFRDADDDRHPGGAEAEDYRSLGLSSLPKNAPFEFIEELSGVYGMDEVLIDRLSPFVTVYSGHAGIDPTIAPEDLLRLLEAGASGQAATTLSGGRGPKLPVGVARPSPRRAYRIVATGRTDTGGGAALEVIIRLGTGRGSDYVVRRWQQIPISRDPESRATELSRC